MSNLSDIKRRITSVKQTRQITGAMETVSVAKMRKAVEQAEQSRAYVNMLTDVMSAFDAVNKSVGGKSIVIVLSSDRGLCGAFDHDIFKLADTIIGGDTVVMAVGKSACDYYGKNNNADLRFADSYTPEYGTAENIASALMKEIDCGASEISIVYSELLSRSAYKQTVKKLIPVEKAANTSESQKPTQIDCFEPSADEVLKVLLPMYLSGEIYGALCENVAAENCARRAAMSSATESADEIIGRLSVEYNRERQSAVTEQIVEIIGSTEALKKQGNLQ
ncbi:MAG: ATP synthase F1 subunit gamma [Clostridiales bacterium]|nr:ATP synthase F1 subunit gamma [Clostridiales bacterium]